MSVILDYEQQKAVQLMLAGENVFVHGRAGTGKSTVIKEYLSYEDPKVNVALLAFTGVAARNIGGATIHSFFGFPANILDLHDALACNVDALRVVDVIIIDEISMVSSNHFWTMDQALKHATEEYDKPFGGKRIIVVGDFCQLPPVITSPAMEEYFLESYRGTFAFHTPIWDEACFQIAELSVIHRQENALFQNILDVVRCAGGGDKITLAQALNVLNEKCFRPFAVGNGATTICQQKRVAEQINYETLNALPTEACHFIATTVGRFQSEIFPTSFELTLKLDCRVMILVNEPSSNGYEGYVNGDTGTLTGFKNTIDECWVEVRLDGNGRIVTLLPHTWSNFEYEVVQRYDGPELVQTDAGQFSQIPLRPAYASTIHKVQGQSLDNVNLRLGRTNCFAPGMLYVALSRLRSMDGLQLDRPLTVQDVILDLDVMEFYENMEAVSGRGSLQRGAFHFNANDIYAPLNLNNSLYL